MSDLKFAQPARRNLLVPVLLAFLILGIVLALVLRFTPHRTADLAITHTVVYPTHTVFKSDSIIVGNQHVEDALYVLTTLRIDDRLHLPLFLKDFTATLTTAEGEEITTSAVDADPGPHGGRAVCDTVLVQNAMLTTAATTCSWFTPTTAAGISLVIKGDGTNTKVGFTAADVAPIMRAVRAAVEHPGS